MSDPFVTTFVDDFFHNARCFPDEPALVFPDHTTTYVELLALVQGIGDWIDAEVPIHEPRRGRLRHPPPGSPTRHAGATAPSPRARSRWGPP